MSRPRLSEDHIGFKMTIWVRHEDIKFATDACAEMGLTMTPSKERPSEGRVPFEIIIPETPRWKEILEREAHDARIQLGYYSRVILKVPPNRNST